MYREEELTALKQQISVRKAIFFAVAGLLAAGAIYAVVSRAVLIRSDARLAQKLTDSRPLEIAAYVLTSLAGVWMLTWWGLALKPLTDCRKLLESVLRGRTHTVDGVDCFTVNLVLRDEKGWDYDRRFYLEKHRPAPDFAPGTPVRVIYHDKLLVSAEVLQA